MTTTNPQTADGKPPAGNPGRRHGQADDPLARALAALAEACDQVRNRPAALRELRRIHHHLAVIRSALIDADTRPTRIRRSQRPSAS